MTGITARKGRICPGSKGWKNSGKGVRKFRLDFGKTPETHRLLLDEIGKSQSKSQRKISEENLREAEKNKNCPKMVKNGRVHWAMSKRTIPNTKMNSQSFVSLPLGERGRGIPLHLLCSCLFSTAFRLLFACFLTAFQCLLRAARI